MTRLGLQMRNAMLEIFREMLYGWRKRIEGLKGKFRLLIFDVTIQKDSHGGAQKEYETKSNAKHGRR